MKPDSELEQDVREELLYDARIDDPTDIAVAAEFGLITLRGTVPTFFQKRATENAVSRVAGVIDVDNRIDVRLMTEHQREDAEIRGAALQRLMSDAQLPADHLDVHVKDGWVKLSGDVDWLYQADAAYEDVAGLVGVVGVSNDLAIRSDQSKHAELADRIQSALVRNAQTDADKIAISTHDGRVALEGSVSSLAERHAALAAAWSAPGVLSVDDRLEVAR
jgi:osmotically-inducible protein OsmY